jgi:hypothetical protein
VRTSRNKLREHLGKVSRDNHGMNIQDTADSFENKNAFSQKVHLRQDPATGRQM